MEDSMIERVARALFVVAWGEPSDWVEEEDEMPHFRSLARAAIEAMRRPTEGMIAVGIDEAESCTDGWTASAPCIAEHMWPAMIDAALSAQHGDEQAK